MDAQDRLPRYAVGARPVRRGGCYWAVKSMIRMSRMNVAKWLPRDSWLWMPEVADRPHTSLNVGLVPTCTAHAVP